MWNCIWNPRVRLIYFKRINMFPELKIPKKAETDRIKCKFFSSNIVR